MPKPKLDEFDIKILEALQLDGRLTNVDLADRIGLSPSPCLRRVRRLEADGFIEGYAAKVNRGRAGLGVTVFVEVKLDRHRQSDADNFGDEIRKLPQVVACHLISGQPDFLLEIVLSDLGQFAEFVLKSLRNIPVIKEIHSSFVLETVKPQSPLPLQLIAVSPGRDDDDS
jgi:Lrp/AsnC family transcriptional regulator, leucine-responsive regulatory protein